jgi:polyisoprenoid-binding protein YceI
MQEIISVLTEKKLKSTNWLSEWSIDHKTSEIRFSVAQRNFLAQPFRKVEGKFKVYEGLVQSNAEDFSGATIYMIIEANSIYTEKNSRDKQLLSEDFFDVEQFPFLRFRSFYFERGRDNKYILEGELTIRGISKRVVVDVSYYPGMDGKTGKEKICFECEFQINRYDYGLRSNIFFETFIEREVTVQLNLEFLRLTDSF